MVTVVQRPQGLKILDQDITATVTNSSGDALINFTSHSLSTGDFVWMDTDIDEYNGMWYVTTISANTFKISENSAQNFVKFYQVTPITYYQTVSHEWSSAFLPIVYKATNDHWPVNSIDPSVNYSSQNDDNGYTELTLSGSPGVMAFEYIKLEGGNTAGVYQIIESAGAVITIDLPYDAANTFATAQKYYNNYQVLVNIYAGLPSGHPWEDENPAELVATLSLTPNENNTVMFSVADYIRKQLNIRNNPILFSMPLNLDFFTGFSIEMAETYDVSDNYSVSTYESAFTEDGFQGYAIAGKLPFKGLYSGFYSDYVYVSGLPAEWLNNLSTLIGIAGKYFDLSFIKNIEGDFELSISKYSGGYRYEVELVPYEDQGVGVYRLPVTFNEIYDQYCLQVFIPAQPPDPGYGMTLATFQNTCDPGDATWTTGGSPSVSLNGIQTSGYLTDSFASLPGGTYSFSYQYTVGGTGSPTSTIQFRLLDDACNVLGSGNDFNLGTGVQTGSVSIVSSGIGTKLGIRIVNTSGSRTYTIDSIDYDGTPGTSAVALTQEICVDIIGLCIRTDSGDIVELSRRLLEDDSFRLLEDNGYRTLEE